MEKTNRDKTVPRFWRDAALPFIEGRAVGEGHTLVVAVLQADVLVTADPALAAAAEERVPLAGYSGDVERPAAFRTALAHALSDYLVAGERA